MIGLGQVLVFCVCLSGGACFVVLCCSAAHDLSVVFLLSTHDNLLSGTMTATVVMMSAASVQKKKSLDLRKSGRVSLNTLIVWIRGSRATSEKGPLLSYVVFTW